MSSFYKKENSWRYVYIIGVLFFLWGLLFSSFLIYYKENGVATLDMQLSAYGLFTVFGQAFIQFSLPMISTIGLFEELCVFLSK